MVAGPKPPVAFPAGDWGFRVLAAAASPLANVFTCTQQGSSTRREPGISSLATLAAGYDYPMTTNPSTPEGATIESFTPLQAAAISLHEAYLAFRAAGFDDKRALRIIALMATNRG